jgi:hypothetical protein
MRDAAKSSIAVTEGTDDAETKRLDVCIVATFLSTGCRLATWLFDTRHVSKSLKVLIATFQDNLRKGVRRYQLSDRETTPRQRGANPPLDCGAQGEAEKPMSLVCQV